MREAAAPAAAQITEAEATVREARGGFAAAFSAQLQLFASVCAGRHLEGIAIVQSEWLPFELAAGCARDASLPHALRAALTRCVAAVHLGGAPRAPANRLPRTLLVASDVWPVAERRHSDDRRRHGFLHRMLHTHDAPAAGAPAAAPVVAKAEGGGGVDMAALHRTAAPLRPSMMELGMMSPRRQTSGGLPLDTPRQPMEGTSQVLSAAGLRLAAAMARGGLYADGEARSALRDDAHRLLTPPPPGYNDDAAARGGRVLSRAACDASACAAARDDALVAAVRASRGADADGAAAAVRSMRAEARRAAPAALRASKKGKAKTIGSGEAALRALLIRGGGGGAGATGAAGAAGALRVLAAPTLAWRLAADVRAAGCLAPWAEQHVGARSRRATLPLAERRFEWLRLRGRDDFTALQTLNDSSPSPPPPSTRKRRQNAAVRRHARAGAIDALLTVLRIPLAADHAVEEAPARLQLIGVLTLAYKALTALVTAHPAAQRAVAAQLAKLAPAHLHDEGHGGGAQLGDAGLPRLHPR